MCEVKYDGRMFDNLVRLKKEIKELLMTIDAVMNDMTLKKVNLKQHKKLEDDMNNYYRELKKLTLNGVDITQQKKERGLNCPLFLLCYHFLHILQRRYYITYLLFFFLTLSPSLLHKLRLRYRYPCISSSCYISSFSFFHFFRWV